MTDVIETITKELLAHGEFGSSESANRLNAETAAKAVISLLASSFVPDGWKAVPVEPTAGMLEEAYWIHDESAEQVWEEMVKAAPTPPNLSGEFTTAKTKETQ